MLRFRFACYQSGKFNYKKVGGEDMERSINKSLVVTLVLLVGLSVGGYVMVSSSKGSKGGMVKNPVAIRLPQAALKGKLSLEETIKKRRSVRSYKNVAVTLPQISQLLWAAQGITSPQELRATPSAGALYPLEIYVVAGNVDGLGAGVYKYGAQTHTLTKIVDGDKRADLCRASLLQACVDLAPVSFVICGVFDRTMSKYEDRGRQYVHMEVGCVAQNVYLQAGALGLATIFVGAFDDDAVKKIVGAADEVPLSILPVGKV